MSDTVESEATAMTGGVTRVLSGQRATRLRRRGAGEQAVIFLHTGRPGRPPFAGSSALFSTMLAAVDLPGYRLIAPDLPGAGGTDLLSAFDLHVDGVTQFIAELIHREGGITEVHVVAQGAACLPALSMARTTVADLPVRSLTLIGANTAAPTGDSVQNVSLLHPPVPAWGPRFHRWAVRRLAYAPESAPAWLVEELTRNAAASPHSAAVEVVADPLVESSLFADDLAHQDLFFAYCRDVGFDTPISLVAGGADPTMPLPRLALLAQVLSESGVHLDVSIINQAAHFVQFDRPFPLARLIEANVRRGSSGAYGG
jgi:pimeloyl-ACP methyl ester carboxylesterase